MPSSSNPTAILQSLLYDCGYSGNRLAKNYKLNGAHFPLVGFANKPWDFDSACIAVVETDGDALAAANACQPLGAPIVWVRHNGSVDWWVQHATTPERFYTAAAGEFAQFVQRHTAELRPGSVYRAKNLGRLSKEKQLGFVDIGLMPLLRKNAGQEIGGLVERMISGMLGELKQNTSPSKQLHRDVFRDAFRLLAGKILKDKGVEGFADIHLDDPAEVLRRVCKHYGAAGSVPQLSAPLKRALKYASSELAKFADLRSLSPESLAYVYEQVLVDKSLRKDLGIHATPPYLVDYIVWRLYDWILEIPAAERHVFEPACGHAPFLLAAMRMLRMELNGGNGSLNHRYLKGHLHGIEIDPFASEIARLSLTLADVPQPDGWDLRTADMYASDVLAQQAARCRIMLCNPPFEPFAPSQRPKYKKIGLEVRHKKAVELLVRTLPNLPVGAVLGIVVPQAVVNGAEAKGIRSLLLRDFELLEICRFPGKVFTFAEMETAVILGRRHSGRFDPHRHRVRLRTIGEHGIEGFAAQYVVEVDTSALQSRFSANPDVALAVPALDEVWTYLATFPRLREIAAVGRGIEFKGQDARGGVAVIVPQPKPGYPAGYAGIAQGQSIFSAPPVRGIASRESLIENPRQGLGDRQAKVLVNRTRAARNHWRLKALLDPEGLPVKNNFFTVCARDEASPSLYLWALLNSPVANAFIARETMQRDNVQGDLSEIPVPHPDTRGIQHVVHAAEVYRHLASRRPSATGQGRRGQSFFDEQQPVQATPSESEVQNALLVLDAAILRLYNMPARLERQLLDFFRGHRRKGVGCTFGDYFPSDFKSLVPLHEFISDSYRHSTISEVAARLKPGESAAVLADLRAAARAFKED